MAESIGSVIADLLERYRPPLMSDEELAKHELELRREVRRDRLRASGIARHLADGDEAMVLNGTATTTDALRLVRAWVAAYEHINGSPWLWLGGPVGVGKTLAAAHAIAEWGGRYVSFLDVLRMHADRERHVRGSLAAWDRLGDQHLVVMDEVGLEEDSQAPRARVALHEFVEMRRKRSTPTIALTNQPGSVIRARFAKDHYDKRTASRLGQVLFKAPNGLGLWDVGGTDLRGGGVL